MNGLSLQRICLLIAGGGTVFVVPGCSTLFDAPSQEGVQIVSQAGRAVGIGNASDISSSDILDLTSIDRAGGVALTSSDALRDLQERPAKTPAERRLVQAVALFDRERISQARRLIDQPLIRNLGQAADRALAHMYRGFVLCYENDRSAGANEFHRMYAEVPEFVVTVEGPGYPRWSPVLNEVTAQRPARAKRLVGGSAKPSSSRSTLLVSKTADGSSQLLLNLNPGGSIVFDGQRVGESPPVRLIKVNPGVHSFALSGGQGEPFAVDVDVGAGERIEIRRGTQ